MLHWNDCDLLRWHAVHVFEGLEETDLNCCLYIQDIRCFTVQLSALQVRLRRNYLALDLSLSFGHNAKTLPQHLAHPHVLQDDLLYMHSPRTAHLLHILTYLAIYLFLLR